MSDYPTRINLPDLELEDVSQGDAIAVLFDNKENVGALMGEGIAVQRSGVAKMADGSDSNPIILDLLKKITSSAAVVLVLNESGRLLALEAPGGSELKMLVSKQGAVYFDKPPATPCFELDALCECESEWIAGFKDNGDGTVCLTRLDPDSVLAPVNFNVNQSVTISVLGNGTQDSPYSFHVKLSQVAGNQIQSLPDGLFVGAP